MSIKEREERLLKWGCRGVGGLIGHADNGRDGRDGR